MSISHELLRKRFPLAFLGERLGSYSVSGFYLGNWSDERPGALEMVTILKDNGIRAKTGYSPYVGHRMVLVYYADLPKAVEVLKKERMEYESKTFAEFLDPPSFQAMKEYGTNGMERKWGPKWESDPTRIARDKAIMKEVGF